MKCTTNGLRLNKDLVPFKFCPSIGAIYSRELNPNSTYLRRFYALLPTIAQVGCVPTTPEVDKAQHFLTRTSTSSARGYIKKICRKQIITELYAEIQTKHPHHLAHLPSILSPHKSEPLVGMSRSIPSNRLQNWDFLYGILRKLRLPIYDPTACPICWCGTTHDY